MHSSDAQFVRQIKRLSTLANVEPSRLDRLCLAIWQTAKADPTYTLGDALDALFIKHARGDDAPMPAADKANGLAKFIPLDRWVCFAAHPGVFARLVGRVAPSNYRVKAAEVFAKAAQAFDQQMRDLSARVKGISRP